MNTLRCFFGFHRWRYETYRFIWHYRICKCCGKRQKTHAAWDTWINDSE